MNERLKKIKSDSTNFGQSRTKNQKGAMIGSIISDYCICSCHYIFFTTNNNGSALYRCYHRAEIGQIKEALDAQGVTYEIAPGGTSILVPEEQVDALKVSTSSSKVIQNQG